MLDVVIVVTLFVAYLALLAWLTNRAFDSESWFSPASILAMAMLVMGLSVLVYAQQQEDNKGPCVEYRTEMQWNPATKTMMPARFCVNRGEWVKS